MKLVKLEQRSSACYYGLDFPNVVNIFTNEIKEFCSFKGLSVSSSRRSSVRAFHFMNRSLNRVHGNVSRCLGIYKESPHAK